MTALSRRAGGLVFCALALAPPGVAQEQEPIRVALQITNPEGAALSLPTASRLTAHREGAVVNIPLSPKAMQVELPGRGRWRLCLDVAGLWARCQQIELAAAGESSFQAAPAVTFTAWPASAVRGRVRAAEDGEVPERLAELLRVFAGPPPGFRPPADFRDSELTCSIAEDGSFLCPVPATRLYAAVRLSGYVSRYFWDLAPQPGTSVDLGTLRMERGASLAGEVDLAVPGVEPERVEVCLRPSVGPEAGAAVASTLAKDTHTGRVTKLGFFQFGGLRPGSYMLVVEHPSFAATEVGPFDVFDGKETRLREPIRLQPPVELSLQIQPALSPLGEPWRVEVFRHRDWSAGSDRVFSGEAEPAGTIEVGGQAPGLFDIKVEDGQGNRFHSLKTSIEPGGSGFVPITVPIVHVHGTVRLGTAPIRGTLRFGGTHGALRSRMAIDEEGSFSGVLARDGEWTVEIESDDPVFETVRRVQVNPGADGDAELDIELDDTELVGRVVTKDGRPVPDARIKITALSEMVTRRLTSGENGEFRSRALPAGQVTLWANAELDGRKTTSTPATVTLEDEISTGPVELILEPLHSFSGRVSSGTGPIPVAKIYATSLDLPIPAASSAVTDLEGAFVLDFPVAEGLAAFTVLPPGGFLSTSIQRLQSPLELRPASAGGTLTIVADGLEETDSLVTVEREGVTIGFGLLMQWARGHGIHLGPPGSGEPMTFPRLAEGAYRVCAIGEAVRRRRLQEGASWQQIAGDATRCVTGSLTPGGTLELSLAGD